ncbi:MAG: hypothetical protein C3F10_05460 [Dehalococcoidia bacterium]|nr:MAG: hypothetical protein C3F10_05460 [Dehalococcoidia bacterium]
MVEEFEGDRDRVDTVVVDEDHLDVGACRRADGDPDEGKEAVIAAHAGENVVGMCSLFSLVPGRVREHDSDVLNADAAGPQVAGADGRTGG